MIEFDNRQDKLEFTDIYRQLIKSCIEEVLDYEKFNKASEISVVITDNEGIRKINREYRNIDKETDVLSFPMLEYEEGYYKEGKIDVDFEDINPETGNVVLGDIVISLEKAKSQAEEFGHSIQREIAFLTVHSMLHLLGYDHERDEDRVIMREKEEEILNRLGLIR